MNRLSWGFAGGDGPLHGLVLGGGDTQWKLTWSPQGTQPRQWESGGEAGAGGACKGTKKRWSDSGGHREH